MTAFSVRPFPGARVAFAQTRDRRNSLQTNSISDIAVHKPADISSADVLRDLQKHFKPSKFFQPWIEAERKRLSKLPQRGWRKRKKVPDIKLGHGGTLDPIATGVLITGVGKGTKELGNFLGCTKTYETVILFGVATDSYDRVGKVVKRAPYEHITREAVEKALEQFRGKIMQRPSIFSALKIQGKKLYEYAREGKEPPAPIEKRPVEVLDMRILDWYEGGTHEYKWPEEEAGENEKSFANKMFSKDEAEDRASSSAAEGDQQQDLKRKVPPESDDAETATAGTESSEPPVKRTKTSEEGESVANPSEPPTSQDESASGKPSAESGDSPPTKSRGPPAVKITMTVSSGFYVRSLAHDLGVALGSNAIMSSLIRIRQGDFDISPENIIEYKDLEAGEEVWGPKLQGFLDKWAKVDKIETENQQADAEAGEQAEA